MLSPQPLSNDATSTAKNPLGRDAGSLGTIIDATRRWDIHKGELGLRDVAGENRADREQGKQSRLPHPPSAMVRAESTAPSTTIEIPTSQG